MKIADARTNFRFSNKTLRRARRLYVALVRKTITNTMQLEFCARRMRDAGLYAKQVSKSVHNITFAILRIMWKLDGGSDVGWPNNPNCWFRWAERNDWHIPTRTKIAVNAQPHTL